MKKWLISGILLVCILAFSGCGNAGASDGLKDGSYTAEMKEYSNGWKEFVTITVKNGEIVTTEYNAENASGFIKSWDNTYMMNMKPITGTYPNEYTRYYAAQLTGQSSVPEIEVLSGASSSGGNFVKLSRAVVEQAAKGDSTVVVVDTEQAGQE